jgi:2-polyprenyl-3-methyl-5-hydroxy-6-metoxy-1,4-benzoquinol methylase
MPIRANMWWAKRDMREATTEPKRIIDEVTWTPPMAARFWEWQAQFPEEYFSFRLGAVVVGRFRRHLARASRIIDYGAGPGFLIEDLLDAGYPAAAAELDPAAAARIGEKFAGHPKFLGAWTVDEITAQAGQFDVVFLVEVVEHLYDRELDHCLATVRRLLAPGGLAIITTPNDEDRSKDLVMSPETGRLFHRHQHVRSWTAESLAVAVRQRGFEPVETDIADFGASVHAFRRTQPLATRLLRSLRRRTLRLVGRIKPPHLYLVARKAQR